MIYFYVEQTKIENEIKRKLAQLLEQDYFRFLSSEVLFYITSVGFKSNELCWYNFIRRNLINTTKIWWYDS